MNMLSQGVQGRHQRMAVEEALQASIDDGAAAKG